MSSTSEKSSTLTKSLFSAQTIVITGLVWGVLALLFFLLFSVPLPGEDLPRWYSVGTYIFELGAYLLATIICFRNWQSPQMISGRSVWIGISLGLFFYFIGGVVFGCWELIWELDPDVSLADFFYVFSYIFLAWGMVLAITSKRLNLEVWQWGVLALVAVGGVLLAIFVADPSFFGLLSNPDATVLEGVDIMEEGSANSAPSWVLTLDGKLQPFSSLLNNFYIIADVFLLIIATALLLAFWGGRFSQSWRMIAAATFSLYIADMYFKWIDTRVVDYESGGLLEVFFVFTAILFAIGAVLEYDVSTRSRQSRRSRRK